MKAALRLAALGGVAVVGYWGYTEVAPDSGSPRSTRSLVPRNAVMHAVPGARLHVAPDRDSDTIRSLEPAEEIYLPRSSVEWMRFDPVDRMQVSSSWHPVFGGHDATDTLGWVFDARLRVGHAPDVMVIETGVELDSGRRPVITGTLRNNTDAVIPCSTLEFTDVEELREGPNIRYGDARARLRDLEPGETRAFRAAVEGDLPPPPEQERRVFSLTFEWPRVRGCPPPG